MRQTYRDKFAAAWTLPDVLEDSHSHSHGSGSNNTSSNSSSSSRSGSQLLHIPISHERDNARTPSASSSKLAFNTSETSLLYPRLSPRHEVKQINFSAPTPPPSQPPPPLSPLPSATKFAPTPLHEIQNRYRIPLSPKAGWRDRLGLRWRDTQTTWLVLYFLTNLGLTLYNKGVLVRFPFPYTLTALHALCGSIGGYVLLERGAFEPRVLSFRENVILGLFSVLYTVNIAVSNLSLGLVTVPFHQVVRSTTPIFVMSISAAFLGTRYSPKKIISLLPVIAGVGFATFGDYYFTTWGLFLTLFGTFLASIKTVLTNILQSPAPPQSSHPSSAASTTTPSPAPIRLQLHPLDLLTRMSPLAFIQCVFFALLTGELDRVRAYSARSMTSSRALALVANGILAFALNVVSFTANKRVGALSITVAANVKQVLTILFAVSMFHLTITPVNALGIVLTLLGGAWYASVEYREKQMRQRRQSLPSS